MNVTQGKRAREDPAGIVTGRAEAKKVHEIGTSEQNERTLREWRKLSRHTHSAAVNAATKKENLWSAAGSSGLRFSYSYVQEALSYGVALDIAELSRLIYVLR